MIENWQRGRQTNTKGHAADATMTIPKSNKQVLQTMMHTQNEGGEDMFGKRCGNVVARTNQSRARRSCTNIGSAGGEHGPAKT